MISTGLVSVTFRRLAPREIIALVQQGGQQGIEWGGDVHVPHGNLEVAREVATRTQEAGLQIPSYGSYYRVGVSPEEGLAFETVLETALALEAPRIRVWAGNKGSAVIEAQEYARIIADAQRIAALARTSGIGIAFEFHNRTLTDTPESALKLYQDIAQENVSLYWQPPVESEETRQRESFLLVLPYLSHLHVYHWTLTGDGTLQQLPLAGGQKLWRSVLATVAESGDDHFALLEFVADESPEQYLTDAATLQSWRSELP